MRCACWPGPGCAGPGGRAGRGWPAGCSTGRALSAVHGSTRPAGAPGCWCAAAGAVRQFRIAGRQSGSAGQWTWWSRQGVSACCHANRMPPCCGGPGRA
ncbi:hypothetical protein ACTMNL_08020 [Bacillus cereus]